ncbi:odorant receptor 4-like [Microplitis mediator]|uniref:odorant receptor 4-like n=1 Tax=Microplitis mediator TaxID=375433 RepID=UPI002556763F|nr:odorant receptor 4-like [Microplitis mediator]
MSEKTTNTIITSKTVNSNYALDVNRWILKILGVWHFAIDSSYFYRVIAFCHIIICTFLLSFVIIPGLLFIFVIVKDMTTRLRISGCFSFCVMGVIKYYYLIKINKQIGNCIKQFNSDWEQINDIKDKTIMVKYARFGRNSSIICAAFMYGSCMIYACVLPHVSGVFKNKNDPTERTFAFPSHFIVFDQYKSPAYEIVFSIHCCCAFVFASISNATCNLITVLITHACGQLEVLMVWLNDLDSFQQNKVYAEKYSKIIKQHVKIIRFIIKIENLFQQICFIEVVGCTLIICLVGYYILLDWNQKDTGGMTTYVMLLISFVYNIFLYCYVCELLTAKCKLISESTYLTRWYQITEYFARGLILTIAISQKSTPMKAGKLIPLSINTFGTVIRTSVVYLNFLRQLME